MTFRILHMESCTLTVLNPYSKSVVPLYVLLLKQLSVQTNPMLYTRCYRLKTPLPMVSSSNLWQKNSGLGNSTSACITVSVFLYLPSSSVGQPLSCQSWFWTVPAFSWNLSAFVEHLSSGYQVHFMSSFQKSVALYSTYLLYSLSIPSLYTS